MIKIEKDSKFYVYCPAGVVTGGAELLHQLVDILNKNQRDAYIVYFGDKDYIIPPEYSKYKIQLADNIVDDPSNIVILYEGIFHFLNNHSNIQTIFWWLSVDNFFNSSKSYLKLLDQWKWNPKMAIHSALIQLRSIVIKRQNIFKKRISLKKLRSMNAIHAYQSEYAQNFLANHNFKELLPLKDFINTDYQSPNKSKKRENIILYNPKKGMSFTKKLIKKTPQFNWIPLKNMTRLELIEVMRKSKLYIDFGYHPGKDRLPRECALNGCCVITGMRGSAAFFEDIPIKNEYKFDEHKSKLNEIATKINHTILNYDDSVNDFDFYRQQISLEKEDFEQQISVIFDL